jgi:hypothetical protein
VFLQSEFLALSTLKYIDIFGCLGLLFGKFRGELVSKFFFREQNVQNSLPVAFFANHEMVVPEIGPWCEFS